MFYIYKIYDDWLDLEMGDFLQYYLVTDNDDMDDVFFSLKQEFNHITRVIYERTPRVKLMGSYQDMKTALKDWRDYIDNVDCLNQNEIKNHREMLIKNSKMVNIKCPCGAGSFIKPDRLSRHIKSNIHQKYLIKNRDI